MFKFKKIKSRRGFTLVEVLISVSLFVVVLTMTSSIFVNAYAISYRTETAKMLYEEARIAMERIVKEVRKGTIDYEEYFSWHRCNGGLDADCEVDNPSLDTDYGSNYGYYAIQFYRDASGNIPATPADKARSDENVGESKLYADDSDATALGDASALSICDPSVIPAVPDDSKYQQCQLFLINSDGTEKTVIRLKEDSATAGEYRLEMLKLAGKDYGYNHVFGDADSGEGDMMPDTWVPKTDFKGYTFQKIQPDSIKITSLKFIIAPLEDPRKSFSVFEDDIQIQPHVTIILTAEPSLEWSRAIRGADVPSITLQTTVGGRAQSEVKSIR